MTEEELLDEIFENFWISSKGNKYGICYCDLCEVFTIGCKKCHGSTCNCMSCNECKNDFDEFDKSKVHVQDYLTEDEKKTFQKIHSIKKLMRESLIRGEKELNWKHLAENGELSRNDRKMFNIPDEWKYIVDGKEIK